LHEYTRCITFEDGIYSFLSWFVANRSVGNGAPETEISSSVPSVSSRGGHSTILRNLLRTILSPGPLVALMPSRRLIRKWEVGSRFFFPRRAVEIELTG